MHYNRDHESQYMYTVEDLIQGEIKGFDCKAYIPQIKVEIEYESNLKARIHKYSNDKDINSIIYSYLKYELPGDSPGHCYRLKPRNFEAKIGLSDKKLYYTEHETCTWLLCDFSDDKTEFINKFGPDNNRKGLSYHINCWEVLAYLDLDLNEYNDNND